MRNLLKLRQPDPDTVTLTVFRGRNGYTVKLTLDQAQLLSNKLQSFAKSRQLIPFYLKESS